MRVMDIRERPIDTQLSPFVARSIIQQLAHKGEALFIDFNKFQPFILATCGTDNCIRLWDIRKIKSTAEPGSGCVAALLGHLLPVCCVVWSPFREAILASSSYDMSIRVWDKEVEGGVWDCRNQYSHTEFVTDLDWNIFSDGILASAGWDRRIGVWNALSGIGPKRGMLYT